MTTGSGSVVAAPPRTVVGAAASDAVVDDIDARPGSTASLLRTVVGLFLRPLGGWISAAHLVTLAADLGIPPAQARTAIARLKQKGLLLAERDGAIGYRLNPAALAMLQRGDRRIFRMRQMTDADRWCLVSFSIPETERAVRHQLRRRLHWIGAGVVSSALWICPGHLQDEVLQIVDEVGARQWVIVFPAGMPVTAGTPEAAAAAWWDLDALAEEHRRFQESLTALPAEPFPAYVQLIDRWRMLPYLDPGLPPSMLPADWPGARSFAEFAWLSQTLEGPAMAHVRSVTDS
ncbi:PaaX family transcriptional regulator C-terminal domain-containing protein [Microbacterium sp. 179-I 3D4 NHS]|uniref:PaaX family transcriptional regulator n=1 Tax=Microbacterium sp. 179-I 3D4 NHS TaxID=3142381 RepID=UPI0039A2CA6E